MITLNFLPLVLFQILKFTKVERKTKKPFCYSPMQSLFLSPLVHLFVPNCVFFLFFNENRFFYSFCFSFPCFFFVVARLFALIIMEVFLKKEQVLSLSLACMHFFVKLIYWSCRYYWCFFLLLLLLSLYIYIYERNFSCLVYVFSCNLKQNKI